MSDGPQAPAGWYADASGEMRYWNGSAWSEHTASNYQHTPAPAAQAAVPSAAASSPVAIQGKPWRSRWQFWVAIAVAVFFVLGSIGNAVDPVAKEKDQPLSVDVDQFIGKTPDEAHNQLEDELKAEMTTDYDDFSPKGRDVNRYEDIIISANRKIVTADNPSIHFWTLTPGDVAWFEKHPTMPKVKKGATCEPEYGTSTFESVDDLVFVANPPDAKRPSDAQRIKDSYDFDTQQSSWATDWAGTQRASVGSKWEVTDPYTDPLIIKGQAPKAGTTLKQGQLMVIYCSSKPAAPVPLVDKAPAENCMSGYSPCLPIVADLDCGEIGHSVVVTGGDPYRLDRDGDGIGCD